MHLQHPAITDRKIRFALVGCGRIAANHIEALRQHADRAELVAVCDNRPRRAGRGRGQDRRPRLCQAGRPAGRQPPPTASCWPRPAACTRPGHRSRRRPAARDDRKAHGHPLGRRPGRWSRPATRPACACSSSSRTAATHAAAAQARGRAKALRPIYMVTVNVFWTRPQSYYDSAKWRGTWEFDGGAFMNQASHYIDLLDWLVGPVEACMAYTGTLARDIEVEDTGVAACAGAAAPWARSTSPCSPTPRTSKAASPSWARRARCASAAWR
jgi:UDP-N-acetyl-2-amino-2-deoxyglucuronate dehydrogenase